MNNYDTFYAAQFNPDECTDNEWYAEGCREDMWRYDDAECEKRTSCDAMDARIDRTCERKQYFYGLIIDIEEALKEPVKPALKNGSKITTKYGDKYTVNYVIDNIVYCYECGARVHIANITRVSYR